MGTDSQAALLEYDAQNDVMRQILPDGTFRNGGTQQRYAHYTDPIDGVPVAASPPGVVVYQQEFAYGRESGDLYALMYYEVINGTPTWEFSVDSVDIPNWMKDRVREVLSLGISVWVDMVTVGVDHKVTLLRMQECVLHTGLDVSPDERYVAYVDQAGLLKGPEVHVYDLRTKQLLTPRLPPGTSPSDVSFAPDGSFLGVSGTARRKYNAIFRIAMPECNEAQMIQCTRRKGIVRFAWSPDGKWVMLAVRNPLQWHRLDLVAIELESEKEITIKQPYIVSGRKDDRYQVVDGIDWTW